MPTRKLPDIDTLIELNQTLTQAAIAAKYGVSRQAVSQHLSPLGGRPRADSWGLRWKLYHAIVAYKQDNDGCAPSIRELMAIVGIASQSTVHYHLRVLEQCGRIEREGHVIRITGARWLPPER